MGGRWCGWWLRRQVRWLVRWGWGDDWAQSWLAVAWYITAIVSLPPYRRDLHGSNRNYDSWWWLGRWQHWALGPWVVGGLLVLVRGLLAVTWAAGFWSSRSVSSFLLFFVFFSSCLAFFRSSLSSASLPSFLSSCLSSLLTWIPTCFLACLPTCLLPTLHNCGRLASLLVNPNPSFRDVTASTSTSGRITVVGILLAWAPGQRSAKPKMKKRSDYN